MNNELAINLTITDAAAAHIRKWLAQQPGAASFRLSLEENKRDNCLGVAYKAEVVAQPQPGDQAAVFNEINVVIPTDCVDALHNVVVDFVSKDLGIKKELAMGELVFHNPNAKNSCGCGKSFTL